MIGQIAAFAITTLQKDADNAMFVSILIQRCIGHGLPLGSIGTKRNKVTTVFTHPVFRQRQKVLYDVHGKIL